MKKIKISQLPESSSYKGLFTIGSDDLNRSVKVSLEPIAENRSDIKDLQERMEKVEEHVSDLVGEAEMTEIYDSIVENLREEYPNSGFQPSPLNDEE